MNFKAVWIIFEILMSIRMDPLYEDVVDKIIDSVEEPFFDNKKIMKLCRKARKALNVPDDDEENSDPKLE